MQGIVTKTAGRGPSASGMWSQLDTSASDARTWYVPSEDGATLYAVHEPSLALAPGSGVPLISLTLALEHQPQPFEHSLVPLVRGGACTLTVEVLPGTGELSALLPQYATTLEPLFPRRTTFTLERGDDGETLAEAVAEGASGRAAIAPSLNQADALAVLRAIRGEPSGLSVMCELAYRAVGPPVPAVRLELDQAVVHDFLAGIGGPDTVFLPVDLENHLGTMISQGIVKVSPSDEEPLDLARRLLRDFLRLNAGFLIAVPGEGESPLAYRLGAGPGGNSPMSYTVSAGATAIFRTFRMSRALENMLAPCRQRPFDSFISAVCPSSSGRGFEPVAERRVETGQRTYDGQMASFGETAAALPAVLKTRAGPVNAQFLAASNLVVATQHPQHLWAINDLVLNAFGQNVRHNYPQIDGDSPIWPDYVTPKRFWYAPELTLISPDPTSTPDPTPFMFSFTPAGHDEQGRPGLEATIHLSLRPQMPEDTRRLWEARGKPAIEAVRLNGLAASIEVPFRDQAGRTQVQAIPATALAPLGEGYDVTFQLTDQWARLAYGALAIEGFQQQPVRLSVSYVFPAYVPVSERETQIAWGEKRALPVQADGSRSFSTLAAVAPLRIERPPSVLTAATVGNISHALSSTAVLQPKRNYGVRTQGHTDRIGVTIPCNRFGALYVQLSADGTSATAVGCQDAFTLGQLQLKLYEQAVTTLDAESPPFTALRSLQVPGRFLVLPKAYTVTRYEPGDARAYRPALFLFSNIDAVHYERTRCVVMATLEPAVSPYWRARLLDELRAGFHPSPTLEWPTELSTTPVYDWALVTGGATTGAVEVATARTPDGFQVSLSTGIDGILQLKAMLERGGITAGVRFPLADGTSPASVFAVDLDRIAGPFMAGAIEIARSGDRAVLTNRAERALDIDELYCRSEGNPGERVPVEQRLAPGQSATVTLSAGTTEVYASYTPASEAGTLEEVRTFVEDIYLSAVFQASFDFAAQGLASVSIEARIAGIAGSKTVQLIAAEPRAELTLVLPLTTYLAQPTLQYALTRTPQEGAESTGPWHDWRLDTLGSIIEINNSLIRQE